MKAVQPWSLEQVEAAQGIYADHWYYYFGGRHKVRTYWHNELEKEEPLYEKPTAKHFIRFVDEVVWTLDEDDEHNPLKKFPANKSYIHHYITHVLFKERFIVVPKSRRLMMTWIHAIYCLWFALAHEKRNVVWQAQKGDKVADTMENKILHVLTHLPTSQFAPFVAFALTPRIPAGWDDRVVNWYHPKREQFGLTRIRFLNWEINPAGERRLEFGSRILGVPEGENQTRQYTITLFVGDEFAFWKQPRLSLKGIRPTLGRNGQGILISSANPGYMEEMIAVPELAAGETLPVSQIPEHIGTKSWRSSTGWFVAWTHYTADDEKRSIEWTQPLDPMKIPAEGDAGYARLGIGVKEWKQEYEIDFSVHEGTQFYPEWSNSLHNQPVLNALVGEPMLLGWDFGLTPATVIAQVTPSGHVIVVDEFVSDDAGIKQHCELLTLYMDAHYPWWRKNKPNKLTTTSGFKSITDEDYLNQTTAPTFDPDYEDDRDEIFDTVVRREMVTSYIDPAGQKRAETDMTTPIGIMKEFGFNPKPSIQDIRFRTEETRKIMTKIIPYPRADRRLPVLMVNSRCKMLIRAMEGGCKQSKIPWRKEKNEFSHVVEALEYLIAMLSNVRGRRERGEEYGQVYRPFVQQQRK